MRSMIVTSGSYRVESGSKLPENTQKKEISMKYIEKRN
jgi:hypothetical protein